MRKYIKKLISGMLTLSMFASTLITSQAATDVNVSVNVNPKVDIMLTSKDTNLDLSNFEKDLKNNLIEKGININNIKFQTVQREYQIVESDSLNFAEVVNNWKGYGALCWKASNDGYIYLNDRGGYDGNYKYNGYKWSQINSTSNSNAAEFSGSLLLNPNAFDSETLTADFNVVAAGNLHNGFCFNVTENSDGTVSGYFFSLCHHIKQVGNYTTPTTDAVLEAAAFYPKIRNQSYSLYLYRFDHWQPDCLGWQNTVGLLSCCWFNNDTYYPANGVFTKQLPIYGGTATILKG